jgi:hypothetical protein
MTMVQALVEPRARCFARRPALRRYRLFVTCYPGNDLSLPRSHWCGPKPTGCRQSIAQW